MLNVVYAESDKQAICAECPYGECHWAECDKQAICAKCPYGECRYAECHGTTTGVVELPKQRNKC